MFLQARSNFKNDHMRSAASVLLASDKGERTKEIPAVHTGTTFLQTETNTVAKDDFRQIHNTFPHGKANTGINHINKVLTHGS